MTDILARVRTPQEIKDHKFTDEELYLNHNGPCGHYACSIITGSSPKLSISAIEKKTGTTYSELARLLAAHNLMLIPYDTAIQEDRLYIVSNGVHWIVVDTREGFFARDAKTTYDKDYFENSACYAYEVLHYNTVLKDRRILVTTWSGFDLAVKSYTDLIAAQKKLAAKAATPYQMLLAGLVLGIGLSAWLHP